MPDVVIWMISGSKRVAYYRCPAYLLLWSANPDYRGKYCGQLETYTLKVCTVQFNSIFNLFDLNNSEVYKTRKTIIILLMNYGNFSNVLAKSII